jgi:hypothetical protein
MCVVAKLKRGINCLCFQFLVIELSFDLPLWTSLIRLSVLYGETFFSTRHGGTRNLEEF